jgi:hypothetical protein
MPVAPRDVARDRHLPIERAQDSPTTCRRSRHGWPRRTSVTLSAPSRRDARQFPRRQRRSTSGSASPRYAASRSRRGELEARRRTNASRLASASAIRCRRRTVAALMEQERLAGAACGVNVSLRRLLCLCHRRAERRRRSRSRCSRVRIEEGALDAIPLPGRDFRGGRATAIRNGLRRLAAERSPRPDDRAPTSPRSALVDATRHRSAKVPALRSALLRPACV